MQQPDRTQAHAIIDPAELWGRSADQLRNRLSRTAFDTWLRDLQPVRFDPPRLYLYTANAYARDQILEHYAGVVQETLTAVAPACQAFTLLLPEEDFPEEDPGDEPGREEPGRAAPPDVQSTDREALPAQRTPQHAPQSTSPRAPDRSPGLVPTRETGRAAADDRLELTPRYLSTYDAVVRPERIITFPAYYLRWLPYLGVDLAWLPIGFRQVAFLRGVDYQAGSSFQASGKEVARWSGMGQRTFWRRVKDPLLRWFIRPLDDEPAPFSLGADGRPHREPSRWEVVLSMPLTPQDQRALRSWLENQLARGLAPVRILDAALQLDPDLLLPPPSEIPEEVGGHPVSVQQVVRDTLPSGDPDAARSRDTLADNLAAHLLGNPLMVSHYFVQHWLPVLGAGPGWMVTLLRSLTPHLAAIESEFEIPNGYPEIAARLGIKDPWRIARWLRGQGQGASHLAHFLEELDSRKQSNQQVARAFWITRVDPLTPADRQALSDSSEGCSPAGVTPEGPRVSGTLSATAPRVSGSLSGRAPRGIGTQEDSAAREFGTLDPAGGRVSGSAGQGADRESGTVDRGQDRDSGTGYSGGLNPESSPAQLALFKTTTTVNPATIAASDAHWSWNRLLAQARIAHPRVAQLQQSDPAAFVSWLLYAASPRGRSLRDPIGHAVARLLEEPRRGAGPAYEELAELGPQALADLIRRELTSGDARWAHAAWGRAMQDAGSDRLQELAELLGIEWRNEELQW